MQKAVCLVCWRKPKNVRNISRKVGMEIKEHVFEEYDTDAWSWLPTVICAGCYKNLHDVKINSEYVWSHTISINNLINNLINFQVCSEMC